MLINNLEKDTLAYRVAECIISSGGKAYLVGGYVRDDIDEQIEQLFEPEECDNYSSPDIDFVVTGIEASKLGTILPGNVNYVGKAFGVFKVSDGNETVDVALPRKEHSTGPKHTDFDVQSDHNMPITEDLKRRDLTINAIAFDVETGKYIDPFNGIRDIYRQIIRTVGDPADRFTEDPLRLMRVYRFASQLGFSIHTDIVKYAKDNPNSMASVSRERIGMEFSKLLMGKNRKTVLYALKTMARTGDLFFLFPELKASLGFKQHNPHHYLSVLEHVFMAVRYAIAAKASLACRYAVLLHDIAKPETFSVDEKGCGHFYKHELIGSDKAREAILALALPNELADSVHKLVLNHLNPPIDGNRRTIRRFLATMGDLTNDALLCRKADGAAHTGGRTYVQEFDRIQVLASNSTEIRGFSAADLALDGNDIRQMFNIVGREIGVLKNAAAEAVIAGEVENTKEALIDWTSTFLRKETPKNE